MSNYQRTFGYGLWHMLASRQQIALSGIGGKTPLKVWSGKAAQDYDSLRVYGCPSYYHVRKDKLDPRAKKGVFIRFKRGIERATRFGILRTGSLSSAEMSRSMRLQY